MLDKDYAKTDLLCLDANRKDLIGIEVDESTLNLHTQVFVCQAGRQPVALDIPPRSSPGFSITSISIQKLAANIASVLEFSGTRLTQVEKAMLEQKATLDTFASPDGSKILVRFTVDSPTTIGKKTLVSHGARRPNGRRVGRSGLGRAEAGKIPIDWRALIERHCVAENIAQPVGEVTPPHPTPPPPTRKTSAPFIRGPPSTAASATGRHPPAHPSARWTMNCNPFQLAMLDYNLNCSTGCRAIAVE